MTGRTVDKRIIVNADDLGLCASVNTAIFDVFRVGNLNSATLMVNMPGTVDAVQRLKDLPGLAVGLHFCITEGRALSGASSLTDARGTFMDRGTLTKRAVRGLVDKNDIRREFEAQLKKCDEFGIRPTHSDSHQHTMMLAAVFEAVAPVIAERGLPVRLVDPPAGVAISAWRRPTKFLKQVMNKALARRHRKTEHPRANDDLVSIHDLDSAGPYDRATYRSMLDAATTSGVTEVMIHPYILGEDLRTPYANVLNEKALFFQRCEAEYAALNGPRVFDGYRMINFGQL